MGIGFSDPTVQVMTQQMHGNVSMMKGWWRSFLAGEANRTNNRIPTQLGQANSTKMAKVTAVAWFTWRNDNNNIAG